MSDELLIAEYEQRFRKGTSEMTQERQHDLRRGEAGHRSKLSETK